MIKSLDHLIIAVNNLEEAEQNYQKILGINPSWRGHHKSGEPQIHYSIYKIHI